MSARPLLCGCTIERPCFEHAPKQRPIPVQPLTFGTNDIRDTDVETYGCDCCGDRSHQPMPWYERYGVSDLWYCEKCGADWKRDDAEVVRVVPGGGS